MGLAASQARLLSITARLSDNELHSQQISNSKVRLADKTQDASQEYIQALNATKLMYTTYDAQGNSSYTQLTPTFLYTYTPLKNQYALQDASGAYYVSAVDAYNYENTDTLIEFLECYDLLTDEKYQDALEKYEQDMEKFQQAQTKYEEDYKEYEAKLKDYNTKLDAYNKELAEYEKAYQEYLDQLNQPNLYDKFAGLVGTSDNPNGQAGGCYQAALKWNSTGCYAHLLAHMLDYKGGSNFNYNYDYKTSYINPDTGINDTVQIDNQSGATYATMHRYVKDDPNWLEIVDAINDSSRLCDGDDVYNGTSDGTKDNIIQQAIDEGRVPTKAEILQSDYLYDPDTNTVTGVKTLKQKAIDLLYMLDNINEYRDVVDWKATLINFTDGDMRNLGSAPTPPDPFTAEMPDMPTKPEEPIHPDYSVELNDQDKAQWYVNLWYMMNGSDTANLVKDDTSTDLDGVFIVASAEKSQKGNYKILDDNLMNSPEWIQFALEHGVVTLVQAQYYNPSEDSGKAPELSSAAITWSATTLSACADISSTEDEIAVARAEAEYNQKLRDIETKDKKYDNDLKKLDTEHNALQTEYDSVKSVIEKNTERSFKAFS